MTDKYCVKSVSIRRYSGPYFLSFGLNSMQENMDQNNSECGHFLRSETDEFGLDSKQIYEDKLVEINKYIKKLVNTDLT